MKALAAQESMALAHNPAAQKGSQRAYSLTIILCRIDGK
jgi:hypothetical protein